MRQKLNICIVLFECIRSMVVLFVNNVNIWDKATYVHEQYEQNQKGGQQKQ